MGISLTSSVPRAQEPCREWWPDSVHIAVSQSHGEVAVSRRSRGGRLAAHRQRVRPVGRPSRRQLAAVDTGDSRRPPAFRHLRSRPALAPGQFRPAAAVRLASCCRHTRRPPSATALERLDAATVRRSIVRPVSRRLNRPHPGAAKPPSAGSSAPLGHYGFEGAIARVRLLDRALADDDIREAFHTACELVPDVAEQGLPVATDRPKAPQPNWFSSTRSCRQGICGDPSHYAGVLATGAQIVSNCVYSRRVPFICPVVART